MVILEIEDGSPWYLSHNIQTVSIDDPNTEVIPTVGTPCYLKATVRNSGRTGVENASVRFYWANPAVGFDRTTANLVGTAYIDLDPEQTDTALCLTPWSPAFVNQGHECVLAEVFHPSLDPLLNTAAFNVSTDRHVAQRNVSVVLARNLTFQFPFEVHNTQRNSRTFSIRAKSLVLSTVRPALKLLSERYKSQDANEGFSVFGFTPSTWVEDSELNNFCHLPPCLWRVRPRPHRGSHLSSYIRGTQ
jgi:hypothetical protein